MIAQVSLAFSFVVYNVHCSGPIIQRLNDGYEMPIMTIAVDDSIKDSIILEQSIIDAVNAGYRHIDIAPVCYNEQIVGKVIKKLIDQGTVTRFELFISAKLPNNVNYTNDVVPALRNTLRNLKLIYVDLYLISAPFDETGIIKNIDTVEIWRGMEFAKDWGLTMSIGLSNFKESEISNIIYIRRIPPAVNQIEIHPSITEVDLVSNQQHDITIMARNPLRFMMRRKNTALMTLSKKYNKTRTQIMLRYFIELRIVPVLIITDESRKKLVEYHDVFDFKLTKNETVAIGNFNIDKHVGPLAQVVYN